VGPVCHGVNCATIQEIARFGLCSARHIFHGNQPNDFMPFSALRKAGGRQDQGKHEEHHPQKLSHNNLRRPVRETPKGWRDFITAIMGEQYHYDLASAQPATPQLPMKF
jgi:hypothetical protein